MACDRAVPIFKITLPAIFSILSNVSIDKEIYFFKFSKVHKRSKHLFWKK